MLPGSGRPDLLNYIVKRIAIGGVEIGCLHPPIGLVEIVVTFIAAWEHAKLNVFKDRRSRRRGQESTLLDLPDKFFRGTQRRLSS